MIPPAFTTSDVMKDQLDISLKKTGMLASNHVKMIQLDAATSLLGLKVDSMLDSVFTSPRAMTMTRDVIGATPDQNHQMNALQPNGLTDTLQMEDDVEDVDTLASSKC